VLTHEAIEVHLASLHAGQDELREDVRELRADNKSLRDKVHVVHMTLSQDIKALDEKFDAKFATLDTRLEGKFGKLDAKYDSLNDKIDAVNADLGQRITQLSNSVASMRGLQKATLLLISILGSLGTVGKFLHWF
jgi:predicted nuclease with TOPRIM domain